jgi:hypothetical protein
LQDKKDIPEVIKTVTESFKNATPLDIDGVGVAHRPSARELERRKRTPEQKAGDEEVKKSLDQIPELLKQKKLLQDNEVSGIL